MSRLPHAFRLDPDAPRLPGGGFDARAHLDQYLDDLLPTHQRAAFELALQTDPILREQVELQRRIDASLRARFTPPVDGLAPEAPAATPLSPSRRPALARLGWLRVAAAIALLVLGGYTYVAWRSSTAHLADPISAYTQTTSTWAPTVVCTNPRQFADYSRDQFGVALRVTDPAGLMLVGWSYDHPVLSENTVTLLAEVEPANARVVVFMDRAGRSVRPGVTEGRHVFTRDVAGVHFVEISPLDHPTVITRLEPAPG